MTSKTKDRQLVWVVLALVAVLLVVGMGFGMMGAGPILGDTWGDGTWGTDGMPGWLLVVGAGVQLLFLVVFVGAGYLGYRALTEQRGSSDPAIEELRTAYARGDLSDDEYERRRGRLENGPPEADLR